MKTYPLVVTAAAAVLSACASAPMSTHMAAPMMMVDNATLPEPVRVPPGQKIRMTATGVGDLSYECREKKDMAGQHEWVFVGPVANLMSSDRKVVGKYYAGPTWESADGSKITGKQLAVAPGGTGNIPFQLVKTEPAMGAGAMTGVTYIQRINTKGGVAPAMACDAAGMGKKQTVPYQADYVFYGS
ncbi:MAG: DUF3455 domain-containing protein [Burkholderiaceae bacterium]